MTEARGFLANFVNGVYTKKTKDGKVYTIIVIFDNIHMLTAHHKKLTRDEHCDLSLLKKIQAPKTKNNKRPECRFWERRGAVASTVGPRLPPQIVRFYHSMTLAVLKIALNKRQVHRPKPRRKFDYINCTSEWLNVFHFAQINVANWQLHKAALTKVVDFFKDKFKAEMLSVDIRLMINNFIITIDKFLLEFPGVSTRGYRLHNTKRTIYNATPRTV